MTIGAPLDDSLSPAQRRLVDDALADLIAEFSEDVEALANGTSVVNLSMVEYLPRKYLPQYDAAFAQRFLESLLAAGQKLHAAETYRLSCVAEELALSAVMERAQEYAQSEEDANQLYAAMDDLFEDADFELLFDPAYDGIEDTEYASKLGMARLGFEDWFEPFRPA